MCGSFRDTWQNGMFYRQQIAYTWYIYGRSQDIPTRDNMHQYQCNIAKYTCKFLNPFCINTVISVIFLKWHRHKGYGIIRINLYFLFTQGNSFFKHTDGCIEYSCTCNCDGSWECPGERAVDKCNTNPDTGCYYCTVGDERHEGNSYFKHVNGCIEYRCVCNCDGSWNCPGDDAVDVCRTNQTTGCYYCEADDYLYQGSSRFPLVRDCYRYHCTCGCDGGWTCKDSIGTYVCDEDGNVPQECKNCNIEGNIFRGDSRFFYQAGCIKYMCTCDCQGRHYCSADDARVTCTGRDDIEIIALSGDASDQDFSLKHRTRSPRQTPSNCRPCNAYGNTYQVGEEFKREVGCNVFTCTCFCDGHHECPAYRTRLKEECKGPSGGGKCNLSFTNSSHVCQQNFIKRERSIVGKIKRHVFLYLGQ